MGTLDYRFEVGVTLRHVELGALKGFTKYEVTLSSE